MRSEIRDVRDGKKEIFKKPEEKPQNMAYKIMADDEDFAGEDEDFDESDFA